MPGRLATQLAVLVLAGAVLAGCGGSSIESDGSRTGTVTDVTPAPEKGEAPVGAAARTCETGAVDVDGLRATGVSCAQARAVMDGWRQRSSCSSPAGASRVACTSRSYRCLGARTDRGIAVSCSRPGRSVAFLAGRD